MDRHGSTNASPAPVVEGTSSSSPQDASVQIAPFRTVALRRKQPSHLSLTIEESSPQTAPPSVTELASARPGAANVGVQATFLSPGRISEKPPATPPSATSDGTTAASSTAGDGPGHGGHVPDGSQQHGPLNTVLQHLLFDSHGRATWITAVDLLNILLVANAMLRCSQTVVLNGLFTNDIGRFFLATVPVWTTFHHCFPTSYSDHSVKTPTRLDKTVEGFTVVFRCFIAPILLLGVSLAAPFTLHPVAKASSTVPFLLFLVGQRLFFCVLLGLVAVQRNDWRRAIELAQVAAGCFAYGVAGLTIMEHNTLGLAMWWIGIGFEIVRICATDLALALPPRPKEVQHHQEPVPAAAKATKPCCQLDLRKGLEHFGNVSVAEDTAFRWDPRSGSEARHHLLGTVLVCVAIIVLAIPQHQPGTIFSLYSFYLTIMCFVTLLPILVIVQGSLISVGRSIWQLVLHLFICFTVAATLRLSQLPRAPLPGSVIAVEKFLTIVPTGQVLSNPAYDAGTRLLSGSTALLAEQVPASRCAVLFGWSMIWMMLVPAGVERPRALAFGESNKPKIMWNHTHLRALSRFFTGLVLFILAFILPFQDLSLWDWTEMRDSFMPLSAGTTVIAAAVSGLFGGGLELLASWISTRETQTKN